jgi:uncharacterized protein YjiS (DUF1127 family)
MTTLTASQILSGYAEMGPHDSRRFLSLRALIARMAALARASGARRAMNGLSEHMLRDLGLTRGDLDLL